MFKLFVLNFVIVAVLFTVLILIGTYLGTVWLIIAFVLILGVGIWYYNYIEEKQRCKRQDK